jgi:hypothetical protein
MNDWKERLKNDLEPVLLSSDPRAKLGAYHDMPYAIFHYPPECEFDLREELQLLATRLSNVGKRVTVISLAECLTAALAAEGMNIVAIRESERANCLAAMVDTIHNVLADYQPLVDLVAARLPAGQNPVKDIVLLYRVGALFPVYRAHALLEQLKGRLLVPSVLFYPGELEGPTGLRFMGVLDPDPNYRPRIF